MAFAGGSEILNAYDIHVLEVPLGLEGDEGLPSTVALVVLRRQTGALLCLPVGVISPEALANGLSAEAEEPVGQSIQLPVEAGEVSDLTSGVAPVSSDDSMVEVLLVDVASEICELLVPFNPDEHALDHLHVFNFANPQLFPMPAPLTQQVWGWIQDPGSGQLVSFYPADEGEQVPETPQAPTPKRATRAKASHANGGGPQGSPGATAEQPRRQRATVASLANALEEVTGAMPAIMKQLEALNQRTQLVENMVEKGTSTISIETATWRLSYAWLKSVLQPTFQAVAGDPTPDKVYYDKEGRACFTPTGGNHAGAGEATRSGPERPSQSLACTEHCTDHFGISPCRRRPNPRLVKLIELFIQQRMPRQTEAAARALDAQGHLLRSCSSSNGETDATRQTCQPDIIRTGGSRSDPNHICGALRRIQPMQRHWMSDVAGHDDNGPHAGGQLACGERRLCALGSMLGTSLARRRATRCRAPSIAERGSTLGSVPKSRRHDLRERACICASGRAEVGHHRLGLHQRDGPHCFEKAGRYIEQRGQGQGQTSRGGGIQSCVKESCKEVCKRGRKAKKSGSSTGGGLSLHTAAESTLQQSQTKVPCQKVDDALPGSTSSARPSRRTAKSGRASLPEGLGQTCADNLPSQTSTVPKILAAFPRWILQARTNFAAILARTFSIHCCDALTPASVVFPLPLMDFGLFRSSGPKLSSQRWRTLVRKRFLHILIIALNFTEGSFGFKELHLLGRRPNLIQKRIHARLWALVTACDHPDADPLPLVPGRSGPEFIERLRQLEHFARRCNLLDPKSYAQGPADFEKKEIGATTHEDVSGEAVQQYSSLDASRLKLVGQGKWHVEDWLHDELYMPYVEPAVLRHGKAIDYKLGPNLARESPEEYMKLALKWDGLGLLSLTTRAPPQDTFTRIFNARKSDTVDRQIGDRRLANMGERSLRGPSQFLPGGYLITSIHVERGQTVFGAITDRKDFYHQCWASQSRSDSNITPFPFPARDFRGCRALEMLNSGKKLPVGRDEAGDRLGKAPERRHGILVQGDDLVYPCFASLLQGDHLGVEFALSGHQALLQDCGLMDGSSVIKGHSPFPVGPLYQGLCIDDYFCLSVQDPSADPARCEAVQRLDRAKQQYHKHEVLGSPEKDINGSSHFKVLGAEVDSSRRTRSLGLVLVGAPVAKRMALSALALKVAALPCISTAVAQRLSGNFVSVFMFRRCLSSILGKILGFADEEQTEFASKVFFQDRALAQEITLGAIFSIIASSDVTARYHDRVFASDASMKMGAYVSRSISQDTSKVLWLGGDKKGAYTKLDTPFRQAAKIIGCEDELEEIAQPVLSEKPQKCPEFSFDFVEICGGIGSVTSAMTKIGYNALPPIELSDSPHFDVRDLKVINWLCCMLKSGKLRALMAEPVCTTFSPAAHPCIRSYTQPKGFDMKNKKTEHGNMIAFRCLYLVWYAAQCGRPSLLEQPRLSKMAWLSIWRFLIKYKNFGEAVVASCQFGSIHRKEFRLLCWGLDLAALECKCPGGHDHVPIAGKFTKPSAMYMPALAAHFARAFSNALRRIRHMEENQPSVSGIESAYANDLLVSGDWKTEEAWYWRKASHINILESNAYLRVLRKMLIDGGDVRFTTLLDSRVAKCSHAKGRSSSRALGPSLKRGAAWQIAGGLYPALGFAPTRINTADAPSREKEVEVQSSLSFADHIDLDLAQKIHSLSLSRIAASWLRLVILANCFLTPQAHGISSSWIFSIAICGPCSLLPFLAVIGFSLALIAFHLGLPCHDVVLNRRSTLDFRRSWIFFGLGLSSVPVGSNNPEE